jgi:hypothetical protein
MMGWERAVFDMEKRERVERTFGDAPAKSGRRALCCTFLGFSLAPMLQVAIPGERRAGERVLHAVHVGSITPTADEIIALAVRACLVLKILQKFLRFFVTSNLWTYV